MTDAVHLRPMTRADLPAVVALEESLFEHDPWSRELFEQELDEVPATRDVTVAFVGNDIVGYSSLRYAGSQGDVNTIAVSAEYQGRGVGTQLLRALMTSARAHGVGHLFLEVRSDNNAAIDLYTTHGFERIDRKRNYYGTDVDAIVMRAKLAS